MFTPVFINEEQQKQFDKNGYLIIPFLSAEEVNRLKNLYAAITKENPAYFHSTSFINDAELKQRINNEAEKIYAEKVSRLFSGIKKLGSSFLTKPSGEGGRMPVHQDWTVVDEEKYCSVTMWVPLQDVNESNGAMKVLPGSHRFSKTLRAPTLPNEFDSVSDAILEKMILLPMKAGEALIFNHALLHASSLNKSGAPRIALTYGLIPEQANLFLYHKNETGSLEKYAMPDDMFNRYTNIAQRPLFGEKVDEFDYEIVPVSKAQLQNMIKESQMKAPMKSIFRDQAKQEFFEREGYAVFPLLSEDEVKDLKGYYESLHLKDEKGFGFHVSMDQANKEMCRTTREKIWSVVLPKLEEHLHDFKPFVASFVVKESNPKGVVPAHQDWSFVDKEEEGYCSITCWTALVDTNIDNGGMGVIRGSHQMMQNKRPSPSPQTPVPLSEHMFSIFPYLKTVDVKAGEVLMFDNRTIHASPPNTTDGVRLAAGVGVTQSDASFVHYYLKPDGKHNTMLKYKIDPDFYLKYDNTTLARMYDAGEIVTDYEVAEELPYSFTNYTSDELIQMIKDAGNEFNVPMCEKLSKLFNYNMDGSQKEEPENEPEPVAEPVQKEWVWIDDRPFLERYSPLNIVREIKKRVVGV
ncbi:MAG: phytanoyl-CoA dioxygenase family protein [Bacteroidota bacterium]